MTATDEIRQKFLSLINNVRSRVALGEFKAKNVLSSASDMQALLIRAATNAVGCATDTCGNYTAVACSFSQRDLYQGIPVYTSGDPCQYDEQCVAFSPAYCESGLCVNALRSTPTTPTPPPPAFGCQRMTATDQTRQKFLSLINKVRSRVALGQFKAKNVLSSASDMQALKWDCNLEAVAVRAVRYCGRIPMLSGSTAMSYRLFGPDAYTSIRNRSIESAVMQWSDIRIHDWPNNNVFNGNLGLRYFANLIRAATNAVGCATTTCGNYTAVACSFSQRDLYQGMPVYTSGDPCQYDEQCVAFSSPHCDSGLCGSVSTPTPPTPAPVIPAFGCQGMTATDEIRQKFLSLINEVRSRVALGEFKAKNVLSSASDMQAMKWDCNLEAVAVRAVRYCGRIPMLSGSTAMSYRLFGPDAYTSIRNRSIESAVMQWSDIRIHDWPNNNVFNGNLGLRYFANLIRAATNAVGCATTTCGNYTAVACSFSQRDLYQGIPVYTSGDPCQYDEQCVAFSPAYCESGLCVNASRSTTVAATTTAEFVGPDSV
ncbi:hypothetical protein KIN20_017171 [Parelaphostrongylus tenuis]|uniref:SCP domain-containing protein n=1 Tax=Parelaphostrongylus tenuis TaxID=148309 RepID=A0AAD5MMV1_PARTN|nr:hypothetical protein KIN20_017171 [Parelaphostrongylus tenuis]